MFYAFINLLEESCMIIMMKGVVGHYRDRFKSKHFYINTVLSLFELFGLFVHVGL